MAFLDYTPEPISLRVADRKFGDQTICQMAFFDSMTPVIDPYTNELSVIMHTRAVPYTQVSGEIGEPIPAGTKGISAYNVPLYANNNCAVYFNPANPADPQNGQVLYYRRITPQGEPDAWQVKQPDGTLIDAAGDVNDPTFESRPLMLQGNAFREQMKHPLIMENLILWNIAAADGPAYGKYN